VSRERERRGLPATEEFSAASKQRGKAHKRKERSTLSSTPSSSETYTAQPGQRGVHRRALEQTRNETDIHHSELRQKQLKHSGARLIAIPVNQEKYAAHLGQRGVDRRTL